MANIGFAPADLELKTHPTGATAILFYDRHRRINLKRVPLGSPFVLPRVGELVRLPIANDVATEYCVVDIRYVYRDGEDDRPTLECGGLVKRRPAPEGSEQSGMKLDCVRVELDPLL